MKNIYRGIFAVTIIAMLFVNSNGDDIIIYNIGDGNNIRFFLLALSIFSCLGIFTEELKDFFKEKR